MKESSLKPGILGNIETVDLMREVAHDRKGHPIVRQLALSIVHALKIPSMNHLAEARAIGQFVQQKVRYVKDAEGIEQIHDPILLIDQINRGIAQADCDDQTLLIATLLLSIGIKPKFRCVRYKARSGGYNHIYLVVYEKDRDTPKQRLVIDPIIEDQPIGFEVPHESGKEYDV